MARPGRPRTKFRHDEHAQVVIKGRRRMLSQSGMLFSNAEYNRIKGQWEPEPQPIDMNVLWEEENRERIETLKKEIAKRQVELDAILASKP